MYISHQETDPIPRKSGRKLKRKKFTDCNDMNSDSDFEMRPKEKKKRVKRKTNKQVRMIGQ